MTVSKKAEKSVYAALAIATFFLAWAFITATYRCQDDDLTG